MFLRVFLFLSIVLFCTSCDKFSFSKNTKKIALDTIVDFKSVDISASFKNCDSIIGKQEKSICFRNTIHKKIGAELQKHQFTIKDAVSEIVHVAILIDSKGKISLESIESSRNIQEQIPTLDSILKLSIDNILPIYPATKRGIPVTTKYKLPIRIHLKE
ncbi:hypothetical protein [uncultured Polaribacter sp.]|uniref:hypothetical protein n=1 Tax=uncultured Polaribacter sp. TaxID=174711 RepID=UPI00261135BE|nr:hypothetical protein [uncultured Polaribacter sp.]